MAEESRVIAKRDGAEILTSFGMTGCGGRVNRGRVKFRRGRDEKVGRRRMAVPVLELGTTPPPVFAQGCDSKEVGSRGCARM